MRGALKWTAAFALVVAAGLALFVLFGLDALRGPIARALGEATGRELAIEGALKPVWDPVHLAFRAEHVRLANPAWAQSRHLFTARAIEARVELLPLLAGRVVLPSLHLERPVFSLERDAQGRRTWDLGHRTPSVEVRHLTVTDGELQYRDARKGLVAKAKLSSAPAGIAYTASGECRGEAFTTDGRLAPDPAGLAGLPERLPCDPPGV